MFTPVPPDTDFVALEQAELARWADPSRLRALRRAAQGRARVGLLRGPAHGQRHARAPSRLGPRLQGPLLPVPRHARLVRGPPRRMGHPRPSGRGRGGEEAGHHGQAADRGRGRHRRVRPALPRVGLLLRRRVHPAHHADRLLARHGRGLLDAEPDLHRVGLVAPASALRPGAALRGPQGRPVLPPLRHGALEPRAGPARRLHRRRGRVGLRAVPARRSRSRLWSATPRRWPSGPRRRGRCCPTPAWPSTRI